MMQGNNEDRINGHDKQNETTQSHVDADDNVVRFERPQNEAPQAQNAKTAQPLFNIPPATKILVPLLIVTYAVLSQLSMNDYIAVVTQLGFTPAQWTGGDGFTFLSVISVFSHLFIHGNWPHVIMNSVMLLAMGGALERMVGLKRYLIVLIVCGLGGTIGQILVDPSSTMPMIGISGSVNGLFAAVITLTLKIEENQSAQKKSLLPFIALWIVITVMFGFIAAPGFEGVGAVAWGAHLGGFFTGLALTRFYLLRKQ